MITGASLVMTSSVANLTLGETGDCAPELNCNLAGWGSEEVVRPCILNSQSNIQLNFKPERLFCENKNSIMT